MTRFYHKLLLLFAGMSLAASPGAFAEGTEIDGLNYVLSTGTTKTATLTFQSNSNSTPNYPDLPDEVVVPATVTSNGIIYTVTGIKYHAFRNCQNITKITLPPLSTAVSYNSSTGKFFDGCTALEEVVFDAEGTVSLPSTTFAGATALKRVVLPQKMTTVNTSLFRDASMIESIESVVWPSAALTVGSSTFNGCTALKEVIGLENVTTINASAFRDCKSLETFSWPVGVKTVNNYTFAGCESLKSVTGMDAVTSMGTYVFQNCSSLETFAWPAAVKAIGNYTFDGCTSLTAATGIDNVTTIGSYAFKGCSSMTEFAIPAGVRSNSSTTGIGTGALEGCTSLTKIILPATFTQTGSGIFSGCTSLTTVVGTDKLTTISANAFKGCTSLTTLEGMDKVTTIDASAFEGCTAFSNFAFPSLTGVGASAFKGCTSLTEVVFAKSAYVNAYAFQDCTNLKRVEFYPTMQYLGENSFRNTGITEVTFPTHFTGNTHMYVGVFEGCKALTTVNIPGTTTLTHYCFGNGAFKNCTALTAVNFPAGATKATSFNGSGVFEGCSALTDLEIPANILTLNAALFTGANGLKNLTLNEGLKTFSAGENVSYLDASKIEELVLPSTLTTIGNYAFHKMPELRKVTLPSTMTKLTTSYLFDGCANLSEVVFPEVFTTIEGSYNFQGCGFETLRFPDSMERMKGQRNFANCEKLTTVVLGKNLTQIYASSESAGINTTNKSYTFYGCTALDNVTVPSGLTLLTGSHLFEGCPVSNLTFEEPATIETIAKMVFAGMTETTEVTLPASLRNLYYRAFYNNPKLEKVTFTAPLADEGVYDEAFISCPALTTVNMPDEFKAIGNRWFHKCTALTDFTMPRDLATIGRSAFYGSGLKNLTFNEKLVELGDSCLFQRTDVKPVFPKTLRRIGSYNFHSNMNVTSGVFDTPVLEEIGAYAFYGCPMTSIDLDNTQVKSIGTFAFYHRKGESLIADIKLPPTLETMGNSSIANSDVCKRIIFSSINPPDVGNSNCAFGGTEQEIYTNAVIYVPPMSYDAYRSTAHISRFYILNDDLRDNVRRITDIVLSQTEISRWIPCDDELLTATVSHLGEVIGDAEVTWESTDPSVVTVDETGTLSFKTAGTAFVYAHYNDPVYGKLTATCRVNVYDHYYDLTLDEPVVMYVGDSQTMVAHATEVPADVYVDNATYTWQSADTDKLAIDADGNVTALAPGIIAVTVRWTDPDGVAHEASRDVTVMPEFSVDFGDEHSIWMYTGDITRLTKAVATFRGEPVENSKLTWQSADNEVAPVSADGSIYGRTPGVTMVYAIFNDVKVPCTVTVIDPAMYNLTIDMPDANGRLHIYGLKDATELSFMGDIVSGNDRAELSELTHDETDRLPNVETVNGVQTYTVNGPLDTPALPDSEIMALAAETGDISGIVPFTEVRVRYAYNQSTGVDAAEAASAVSLVVDGNTVTILGAEPDAVAAIFDPAGMTVYSGLERTVTIGTPGVYLLTVGNDTFKFVIK